MAKETVQPRAGIDIVPKETPPLSLYDSHQLTVTTDTNVQEIVLSTGLEHPSPDATHAGHMFSFNPNPVQMNDGIAHVTITADGTDTAIDTVTVYARSTDAAHDAFGSKDLPFKPRPTGEPAAAYTSTVSLDGDPLSSGDFHLLVVTLSTEDGKPVSGVPITWSMAAGDATLLTLDRTPTLADGTATNGIKFTGSGSASATVRVSAGGIAGGVWMPLLTLAFKPQAELNTNYQGTLTIAPLPDQLKIGEAYSLTATYQDHNNQNVPDGTPITWAAFPQREFNFALQTTYTKDGATSNSITASGHATFTGYVSATSFNTLTGQNDHGALSSLTFQPDTKAPTMYAIDYNSYRSPNYNTRVRFLIMHYTVTNFADSITALATPNPDKSAHYLVPDPTEATYLAAGFHGPRIFNLVSETERAWHAGVSFWHGRYNLNDSSIGIENVNLATDNAGIFNFPDYNVLQMEALKQLAFNIVQRYPEILPMHVLGHSDIAVGRKSDPGPKFPWYTLYLAGVGAWYDDKTKQVYTDQFTNHGMPAQSALLANFNRYGYDTYGYDTPKNYPLLVRAFQLHFRATNYDGIMDIETAAILYALIDKYFGTPAI